MATLILKVTERCNSQCVYCDVAHKSGKQSTMPLGVLESVFRRIDQYLCGRPEEQVEIIWHGGEPLLAGAEYFAQADGLLSRHCRSTRARIRHSLQTNLTLFSEAFLGPLGALKIRGIGTSYDPYPHIRGPGPAVDTSWYNQRFLRATSLLDRAGLPWGMIYVVTRRALEEPERLFHYLTNLCAGGINFNPVLVYGESGAQLAIEPGEFADFLGAIFPLWWARRRRYGRIEPFGSLVDNILEGKTSLGCVDSGSCAYHHVNVAPDGGTSQCGRSADWGLLDYGNVADRTLDAILHDEQRRELDQRQQLLQKEECAGCRFWGLCHGGCPLDSWSVHRSFGHKSEWCEARRGFIARYFEPTTGARYEQRN
jgi:uncharacterized protein